MKLSKVIFEFEDGSKVEKVVDGEKVQNKMDKYEIEDIYGKDVWEVILDNWKWDLEGQTDFWMDMWNS